MMRIGVVSDSHGDIHMLREAVVRMGSIDLLLHAGDLYEDGEDISRIMKIPWRGVVGNCDFGVTEPAEVIVEAENCRLLMVHGHRFGVKSDYLRLQYYAMEKGCDTVIFGHTHEPLCLRRGNILLFNPGSVARPRVGGFSYGIIELDDGKSKGELYEL